MKGNFMRRFALFLIALFALTACGSQAPAVQPTPSALLPGTATTTPSPSPTATLTPTPSHTPAPTYTATPCIGFVTSMVNFVWAPRVAWSSEDYLDKMAVSRIPIEGMECAAPQEIVRQLMSQWLETLKTNSPSQRQCGVEDYTFDGSTMENILDRKYDIKVRVFYSVKPGRFENCGWYPDEIEKDAWFKTEDVFGVYRKNGYFNLIVLTRWDEEPSDDYLYPPITPTAPPCLGGEPTPVATPIGTPALGTFRWYYGESTIPRIPIRDMECAAPQEIVRRLMLQWLETLKTNSPGEQCGLEDYSLILIVMKGNAITPQYEIVASVGYSIKPRHSSSCWLIIPYTDKRGGWIVTGEVFGVYRENGYFRLMVLRNWGT